jgi:hypothetical protein
MYKGVYSEKNFTGLKNEYQFGDIISFEGNLYKAEKYTTLSPFKDKLSWKYIGESILFSSNEPPINPVVGQQWERNGVIYTYFFDGDNYSWVEF